MSTFAVDIANWCEKVQARGDQVLRAVSLEMLSRIVMRSPVGNPDLWKANKERADDRITFNQLRELAGNKPLKERTLRKKLPNVAGKGYTDGRLRGSWVVSLGSPSAAKPGRIDPGGQTTVGAGNAVIQAAHLGNVIYFMSNLPYSQRVEDGWSKQAPAGMVRVTAVEFGPVVEEAAQALPK